jgi:hypothetical protein
MAKVVLDSVPVMYPKLMPIADPGVEKYAKEVDHRAEYNLQQARSTTEWEKIADPGGLTRITFGSEPSPAFGGTDYIVTLEAEYKHGAMAIEMGHAPSGWFKNIPSRAPRGLYILSRAIAEFGKYRFRRRGRR